MRIGDSYSEKKREYDGITFNENKVAAVGKSSLSATSEQYAQCCMWMSAPLSEGELLSPITFRPFAVHNS